MSFAEGLEQLVHIGAGAGDELAAWQAAGVDRMILVEADPDTARALAARVAGEPEVQVIAGAVSADPAPRPFRVCNLPGLSSFRAPAGLEQLFPGLRVLAMREVTPLDPAALVAGLELGPRAGLVIEAPGEALGILQALRDAGLLDRFAAIRLQEGREALYAGAPTAEAIRAWLVEAGYDAEFEPVPEDPDRPRLIARRNEAARAQAAELAMLRGDLAEAEAEADREAARANAALAERDAAEAVAEALRAELDETRALAGERSARIEALTEERDRLRQEAGALTTTCDALRVEADQARQRLELARAELARAEGQVTLIRDLMTRGAKR